MQEKGGWFHRRIEAFRNRGAKKGSDIVTAAVWEATPDKEETVVYHQTPVSSEKASAFLERIEAWNKEDKENPKGSLGMTMRDHDILGSTPPEELKLKPGKTKADLMSDVEILNYLQKIEANIAKMTSDFSDNSAVISFVEYLVRDFRECRIYLRRIGRLPEEYKEEDP